MDARRFTLDDALISPDDSAFPANDLFVIHNENDHVTRWVEDFTDAQINNVIDAMHYYVPAEPINGCDHYINVSVN